MENQQISQEEIKKRMEEIKENCVFCKIVKKDIESKIIFEDEKCLAILDINPISQGHILLMPKEHYFIYPIVPDEIIGHIGVISKSLCDLLITTFNCKDVNILVQNGPAAGQQSQHFMMHLIPKYNDDEINFSIKSEKEFTEEELKNLSHRLKMRLIQKNQNV